MKQTSRPRRATYFVNEPPEGPDYEYASMWRWDAKAGKCEPGSHWLFDSVSLLFRPDGSVQATTTTEDSMRVVRRLRSFARLVIDLPDDDALALLDSGWVRWEEQVS
jgi:hypothetical protein